MALPLFISAYHTQLNAQGEFPHINIRVDDIVAIECRPVSPTENEYCIHTRCDITGSRIFTVDYDMWNALVHLKGPRPEYPDR